MSLDFCDEEKKEIMVKKKIGDRYKNIN